MTMVISDFDKCVMLAEETREGMTQDTKEEGVCVKGRGTKRIRRRGVRVFVWRFVKGVQCVGG